MPNFKRKRIRIKDFNYKGSYAYFITICTFNKQTHFKDQNIVADILGYLKQGAEENHFDVFAYCFMPDHLHLLIIGDENADLVKFIRIFKQKTGYYFKKENNNQLWQKGYFDHVIRKAEYINNIAAYIFENPMRKKIVDDFMKYPYLGSFCFDLNEFYLLYDQRANIDVRSLF